MASETQASEDTPASTSTPRPLDSTPSRSSLDRVPVDLTPTEKLPRNPGVAQSLKEQAFQSIFSRLENAWQALIDQRAQVLASPAAQVQFQPVGKKDRDRIHDEVLARPNSSLQSIMDSTEDSLLELWETRARKLIRDYKYIMSRDIVQEARTMAQNAKKACSKELEKLDAGVPNLSKTGNPNATVQQSPNQSSPGFQPNDVTKSATAPYRQQPASRYPLRNYAKVPRNTQESTGSPARAEGLGDVKADAPDSPTPSSKLGSVRGPRGRRGNNRRPSVAKVREDIRQLSIADESGTFDFISQCLIHSLDQSLGEVGEMLNQELSSAKHQMRAERNTQSDVIVRTVAGSLKSFTDKDLDLKVNEICADVLVEWVSSYRDAIDSLDVLDHKGSKLVQEALLAIERAKTGFYSRTKLDPPRAHGHRDSKKTPKTAKRKNGSSTNIVGTQTIATFQQNNVSAGMSTTATKSSSPYVGRTTRSMAALQTGTTSSTSSRHACDMPPPPVQTGPTRIGVTLSQHVGSAEPLSLSDHFLEPSSVPASPKMDQGLKIAECQVDITLGENISKTRDALLEKIKLGHDGLANTQSVSGRQQTVLATYKAVAQRLMEELEELREIKEREENIRSSFKGLQKVLDYIGMEGAENGGSDIPRGD